MKYRLKQLFNYRVHLPISQSPTYFNLARYLKSQGWQTTPFSALAHVNEVNFDFDESAAETLEYKHCLAALVECYCPEVMPKTYRINDYNYLQVINKIAQQDNYLWILKPALQNNGQNIKIFNIINQIEQHYLNPNRLGGEHVLQQYISSPHLIAGKKYSIRMFVILTNDCGAHLYPHGYFNVSKYPYRSDDFSDLRMHLTNEHLKGDEANVTQIPTQSCASFPSLYLQIKPIISHVINALQQSHPQAFLSTRRRRFAIFGFDFMVDVKQRVWLLEANHGPCFPIVDSHPMQTVLYHDFWQAFISSFILPMVHGAVDNNTFQLFEPL